MLSTPGNTTSCSVKLVTLTIWQLLQERLSVLGNAAGCSVKLVHVTVWQLLQELGVVHCQFSCSVKLEPVNRLADVAGLLSIIS